MTSDSSHVTEESDIPQISERPRSPGGLDGRHLVWTFIPAFVTVVFGLVGFLAGGYTTQFKVLSIAAFTCAVVGAGSHVLLAQGHQRARGALGALRTSSSALSVAAILVMVAFTLTGKPSSLGPAQAATAAFTAPDARTPVSSPFSAWGTSDLPANTHLWLLVRPPNGVFYTTDFAPLHVDPQGEWDTAGIGLGRDRDDIGKSYELHLVGVRVAEDADPRVEDPIYRAALAAPEGQGSVSFDVLPVGAEELDSVRVTLGDRLP
ncbi:hypothetical protein [Kineococcus sp. SYSU DK004]|uniref:hypothetical protein n=1 Tax=Kineococcus sp. SYSU DK004 TaxID=3383125 RepID=UPI003D7CC866